MDMTEETESPPSFRMASIASGIASCMKRKIFLQLGTDFFYPNMYIILVGPPAARKGTAIAPVRELLDRLGLPLAADESSRQKLIQFMEKSSDTFVDPMGIQYNHSSISIHASELTVTIGYNNMALLTDLNDWFDCKNSFIYSTLSRDDEEIINVWVNLLGATTPTLLHSAMPEEGTGGGFMSRCFMVYEQNKDKIVIFPEVKRDLFEMVQHDLNHIINQAGQFKYDKDWAAAYTDWRYANDGKKMGTYRLDGYCERRVVHLLKLCMIFSMSRSDEKVLTLYDFERAQTFMEAVEIKMPRVFEGMGTNIHAEVQSRIMNVMRVRKRMSNGELINMLKSDVSAREMQEILNTLQQAGEVQLTSSGNIILPTAKEAQDGESRAGVTKAVEREDHNAGADSLPGLAGLEDQEDD
jgi:hypothetical protein